MPHDVIVVGGGYAGMAAALQLLRARRDVLVIDAGERRNRFADHSHGFLGFDGENPAAIAATARRQLEAYPTLSWVEDRVTGASGTQDDFTVTTAAGGRHTARRLILATGVADTLPDLPGLAERWGRSAFHCPYCHGYELDKGPVAVIATGQTSLHQGLFLPEWGPTTFFTNASIDLTGENRAELAARGATVEDVPVERLEGTADVILADGRRMTFAGIFVAPVTAPATPVGEILDLVHDETPMGRMIRADDTRQTSLAGCFACGDLARFPHSVSLAVGDGAWTGAQVHRSLMF
uniref:NAD(P)/FAD-dependent oxidoreductase n=1 Tax=Stappia sp. TaxID=1870903 RepID=UPI003BA8C535